MTMRKCHEEEDTGRLGVWSFAGLFCVLRGCAALECGLVSLGLHCFLRLAHVCIVARGVAWPMLLSPRNTGRR